ncbi:hypothetical protein NMG60_11029223 [Bertholletia excelsa]
MATAAAALLLLLLAAPAAHAAKHTVGGSDGWSQSTDFDTWAKGETFTVGDTLAFNYGVTHGVAVLNSKDDYDNCNTGSAVKTYSGGKTTVTLDKTGPMYFACPTAGHCQGGMKLAVNVAAANTTPGTTPSTGTPSPASPATPSTTTTASPPPPKNGAASFADVKLGISLAVAILLAFMG